MKGGKRPGAGRKAGVPNKATAARQEAVTASGETPLDFMLSLMRDDDAPPEMRLDAAKAAAPYVHPRLSSVDIGNKDGQPLVIEIVRFGDPATE